VSGGEESAATVSGGEESAATVSGGEESAATVSGGEESAATVSGGEESAATVSGGQASSSTGSTGSTGSNGSTGSTGGSSTGGDESCTVTLDGAECVESNNTDTDSVGNKPVEQGKGKDELAETGAAETTFLLLGAATMIAGGIGFRFLPRLAGGRTAV
ncbi:LPXTG cell wall anchor domain-containing protein, partial [Streptomyces sp. NPDC002690]